MMRRRSVLAMALALSCTACLFAATGFASVAPTSMSLGVGYAPDARSAPFLVIPSLNASWRLDRRLALRSSAAYLQEQGIEPVLRGFGSDGNLRDLAPESGTMPSDAAHYLPVSLGLRLYLNRDPDHGRGIFIEGAPTAFVAWLPAPYPGAGHDAQLLRGAQASIGARFGAIDGSRGEIGLTYFSTESATTSATGGTSAARYTTTRHFRLDAFALYMAFGFGD